MASSLKVVLFVVVLVVTVGCALPERAQPSPLPSATPLAFATVALPNSASAFDANSLVGKSAPEFALPSADADSYVFRPNDGRKHVIVFYMSYG